MRAAGRARVTRKAVLDWLAQLDRLPAPPPPKAQIRDVPRSCTCTWQRRAAAYVRAAIDPECAWHKREWL